MPINLPRVWSNADLKVLYELRNKGLSWALIGKKINKSWKATARKYGRVDWNKFNNDPNGYSDINKNKKWSDEEMIQLDAYLQAGKSYDFIAEKLGRTFCSIENQAQHTDWKSWRSIRITKSIKNKDANAEPSEDNKDALVEQYVNALLSFGRNEFKRVEVIKEDDFLSRVNLDKSKLYV